MKRILFVLLAVLTLVVMGMGCVVDEPRTTHSTEWEEAWAKIPPTKLVASSYLVKDIDAYGIPKWSIGNYQVSPDSPFLVIDDPNDMGKAVFSDKKYNISILRTDQLYDVYIVSLLHKVNDNSPYIEQVIGIHAVKDK
jgi:hypothetical protein